MLEYIIVKKEKVSQVENIDYKDITFVENGSINFKNLKESIIPNDIFKIPKANQKELDEKKETEFMITTKTIVSLKNKAIS